MPQQSKQNFLSGVNLDDSQLRIPTSENKSFAAYLYNMTANVAENPNAEAGAGRNFGVLTPLEGNNIQPFSPVPPGYNTPLAAGNNYCVGFYSSEQTNQGYAFIWNSNGDHQILVINGDDGSTAVVAQSKLLPFVLNPANFVGEGRCTMLLRSYIDPQTGLESNFKFLIFTINTGIQYAISVDDSANTNTYDPAFFPRFDNTGNLYEPILLLHLGTDTPMSPMHLVPGSVPEQPILVSEVTPVPADTQVQNLLLRTGWQFRVKFIDVFGRESVHGIISDMYISVVGGGCITESNTLPRCLQIQFDGGNPLVDYMQIEYRKTIGNDPAGALWTNWLECETITKYVHTPGQRWYNYPANTAYYDPTTNVVTYQFCANKGNAEIPTVETDMTECGIPRTSACATVVGTQLMLSNNVRGFQPLDQDMISQIKFTALAPPASCPVTPLVEVIVYGVVWKPISNKCSPVYLTGASTPGQFVWGNFPLSGVCDGSNPFTMCQSFADQANPGWIGYLVGQSGAECAVISEQGYINNTTGVWTPLPPASAFNTSPSFIYQSGVACPLMQRWIFKVRAGKYVFRLASHHAKITDSNFKQTSTYAAGRCNLGTVYSPLFYSGMAAYQNGPLQYASNTIPGDTYPYSGPIKELEIDCSTGSLVYDFRGFNDKILVILDMTDLGATASGGNAVDGYYYESSTGLPIEMNPVYFGVNTSMGSPSGGDSFGSFYTDHNGYFFGYGMGAISVYLPSNYCDGNGEVLVFHLNNIFGGSSDYGLFYHGDGSQGHPSGADPSLFGSGCTSVYGYWYNRVYASGTAIMPTYPDSARRYINYEVDLCDGGGAPGIPIVMTKGMYKSTNASGKVEIVAHNRYKYSVPSYASGQLPFTGNNTIASYGTAPSNGDYLIISQRAGCSWYKCGSCTVYSLPDVQVTYQACVIPPCPPPHCRIFDAGLQKVNIFGVNIKGVQTGGVYPVGFVLFDELGRHTFVQDLESGATGLGGSVIIPNLNDPTYQTFNLYQLAITVSATFAAPGFSKISFVVAPNTAFTDYASWAADWIQYVDDTGQDNTVEPTSIRVYYQSMNEYAKNYNYTTNNVWQFQTTGTSTNGGQATPNVGDVIQFIMNGDGTWIDTVVSSSIVFNEAGSFFTISYLPELAGLQNGCLFRVIRPATQQNVNVYYEQCLVLDLDANGQIDSSLWGVTIPLPYYDSYMLQRTIPVPVMGALISTVTGGVSVQSVGSQPYEIIFPGDNPILPLAYTDSGTGTTGTSTYSTNNPNLNHVIIMTSQDLLTYFPFMFESPSPSDFWGSHISNRGRVFFANPNECQKRIGTEVALSDRISDRGLLNNMSYFEPENVFVFDYNTWGQIFSVLTEVSICLFVCEKDHFMTTYGTTQLQSDPISGNVTSKKTFGPFQQPDRKAGTNYGLSLNNYNSLRRYAGTVRWLDDSGVLVKNNFSVSTGEYNTGFIGWIKQMAAQVKQLNIDQSLNGITYWVAGIDPKTFEYYLTTFNLNQNLYINTSNAPVPIIDTINQTLVIDLESGILKGFSPFTPEFYGLIPSYYSQTQFLSFQGGQPWLHHNSNIIVPWGNFYGTQCPCYVTVVVNEGSEKPKRFLACELYVRTTVQGTAGTEPTVLFFASQGSIITEKGQKSQIPPFVSATSTTWQQFWNIADGFQSAAFLCDEATFADPNLPLTANLIDGNPLQGRWMQATFVTHPDYDGSYFELSAVNTYFDFIEKAAD